MISIPSASVLDVGDIEVDFSVTGTANITSISARPRGDVINVYLKDSYGKFISDNVNLIMDDGVDYWWDQGDFITFKSLGDGKWIELSRNEASYVVDGRFKVKSDTFSTNSTSWVDVPGLSIDYSPRSKDSAIRINVMLGCSTAYTILHARILRDSTPITVGDAAGSRTQGTAGVFTASMATEIISIPLMAFDKPNFDSKPPSKITYKVQIRANSSEYIYINRTPTDDDNAAYLRSASLIELLEIKGAAFS